MWYYNGQEISRWSMKAAERRRILHRLEQQLQDRHKSPAEHPAQK